MHTCDAVRDELALDPTTTNQAVQQHVETCVACATYKRRHSTLENVARMELHWQAPTDLTARLLAMTLTPAAFAAAAAPVPTRPKTWHVVLAYVITALSIGISLLIGWQLVALLITQFDLQAQFATLLALPGQVLAQLTQALPESRYVVDFFLRVRAQLVWLLLVAVVWAMLDKWNPSFSFRRQQGA